MSFNSQDGHGSAVAMGSFIVRDKVNQYVDASYRQIPFTHILILLSV